MTLQPSSTVPVIEAAAALEERLIKMVDIERIRYAHFREGSSIRELARACKSKNAGPYEVTLDIMFGDRETFDKVRASGVIPSRSASPLS